MIKNIKIAPKLIIAFLIVAFLAGLIGVVSFLSLNNVTSQYQELYYSYGLPLHTIGEIELYFDRNRVELRSMMLDSADNISKYEQNIADNGTKVDQLLKEFRESLLKEDDKAKVDQIIAGLVPYREIRTKIIDMVKAKDAGAYDLLETDLAAALKPMTDKLEELNSGLNETGKSMDTDLKGQAQGTSTTIIIVVAIAVLLAVGLGLFMSRLIAKPIRKVADAADRLAAGDIDIDLKLGGKDEVGMMANAFNNVVKAVKKLIEDVNMLSAAAIDGKLTVRADTSAHKGDYRKIVEGVNTTLDSVIGPLKEAADCIERISKGDIPEKINVEYRGDFNLIKNSLNTCIDAIKGLIGDINVLVESAVEGKLSVRADVGKHQGDFRKIVEGINNTLEAIVKPVNEAISVLGELSKGNLSGSVNGDYKGDYAFMKNALNDTIRDLKNVIGEIANVLGEMSKGNLSMEITSEYKGDFIELKNSINSIVAAFNDLLSEINVSAEQVATGTRQLSFGNQAISQGATEQASSIEELSASITQIAEQTRQNALNSNKSNEMALAAKNAALRGNDQMKEMLQSMTEINESSENISKIIKVIDDIAFQTNILALNAAVEAARAGLHGKGFAVVAEEVRNLAERSASAAKETTELIEGSKRKVEVGTKIANETATALSNIVESVEKTVQLGSEIAFSSNEQATGISQVNKGIEQLSQVVQNNSSNANEGAAASEELSAQADILKNKVGQFRLKSVKQAALKQVSERKPDKAVSAENANGMRIALNDNEFGKY
jgi:methyl-accepting chemotaxis protein